MSSESDIVAALRPALPPDCLRISNDISSHHFSDWSKFHPNRRRALVSPHRGQVFAMGLRGLNCATTDRDRSSRLYAGSRARDSCRTSTRESSRFFRMLVMRSQPSRIPERSYCRVPRHRQSCFGAYLEGLRSAVLEAQNHHNRP
jgi:hypothetical protein